MISSMALSSSGNWHRLCNLIFTSAFEIKLCILDARKRLVAIQYTKESKVLVSVSILGLQRHFNTRNQTAVHLSC